LSKIAAVLGEIPAISDAVESVGRQMKQCSIKYMNFQKIPNFFYSVQITANIWQELKGLCHDMNVFYAYAFCICTNLDLAPEFILISIHKKTHVVIYPVKFGKN
jgi:hypothetical protein